jgi:selenide,water dikinase
VRPPGSPTLVFTVDFITPIVDDPYDFGAIAAANSLSDVYAMGGEPQAALAICGFPADQLPLKTLEEIFRGGRDKAAEAGCAIVGGHTVNDAELKYGLCVIGGVDLSNGAKNLAHTHARVGDLLVLTKPIGFGIASQAIKKQEISPTDLQQVTQLMATLNKSAKDAALAAGAHAATDVTGFGLLGHLRHLALGAGCAARLWYRAVPILAFVKPLAAAGAVPGGSKKNLAYVDPYCAWRAEIAASDRLILADAQTSGGLLIAVPPDNADRLVTELQRRHAPACSIIGDMISGEAGHLEVVARRGD